MGKIDVAQTPGCVVNMRGLCGLSPLEGRSDDVFEMSKNEDLAVAVDGMCDVRASTSVNLFEDS